MSALEDAIWLVPTEEAEYPPLPRHLTEDELFRGYGLDADSATIPPSADDVRRRLVSELRREDSGASGLPSRPTRLPPADAIADRRAR